MKVSLADLVVLGGSAAVERAAKSAGFDVEVSFKPGRMDASEEHTDVASFAVLEPKADGFRNYYGQGNYLSPSEMLVERANFLKLTVPEMTALIGGMRVLDTNADHSKNGVFTNRPGLRRQSRVADLKIRTLDGHVRDERRPTLRRDNAWPWRCPSCSTVASSSRCVAAHQRRGARLLAAAPTRADISSVRTISRSGVGSERVTISSWGTRRHQR